MSFQPLPSADPIAFQAARLALLTNSYSSVRVEGAALPPPIQDPNPAATSALHFFWQQLWICIQLGPNGPSLADTSGGYVEAALRAFNSFGAALVS